MNNSYFIDHLSKALDFYSTKYDRLIIMGDVTLEPTTDVMETFCNSYDLFNLVNENTLWHDVIHHETSVAEVKH